MKSGWKNSLRRFWEREGQKRPALVVKASAREIDKSPAAVGSRKEKRSPENDTVIAFIQVDNLAEVIRTMPEESKPHLLGAVERTLAEWGINLDGYIKQIGEGRYVAFFSEWGLKQAEKNRFAILDKIRDIAEGNTMSLTLSIGVAVDEDSVSELGRLAESALELALQRGGDQVVVKSPEKVWFFGGKSVSLEKRTKVKARVTAFALKDMISQAALVVVMGHEMADYDCLGAALGVARAVNDLGKKVYIVLDKNNPAVDKILATLPRDTNMDKFIRVGEIGRKIIDNTLLVVVDTHKPALLADGSILSKVSHVAVIDHHRRGEEFITGAKLVYLESYASSTSELVTELLQYLGNFVEIHKAEATALLAGITVDTKYFMYQTGTRTFEAAAYLRSLGADQTVVQRLLQDDIMTVIKKAQTISTARILYGQIVYCKSLEPSHEAQVLAAKTADTMLNVAGVKASFVLWPFEGGNAVSARSNGEINVHAIMEKLGGGGHFTVAAAQVAGNSDDAEKKLLEILEEVFL